MATIRLFLDARRLLSDGSAPVKIAISNRSKTAYIPTRYSLPPDCWADGKVVRGKGELKYSPRTFNELLRDELAKYEMLMRQKIGIRTNLSPTKIRDILLGVSETGKTLNALLGEASSRDDIAPSTSRLFISVRNCVDKMYGEVSLDTVDAEWIKEFTSRLGETCKPNSVSIYLSKLQYAIGVAEREGIYRWQQDPFLGLKRPSERTKHRDLSVEQIRYITSYRAKKDSRTEHMWEVAADLFKLMFCLCGLNIADLIKLREEDIVNGRLQISRQKTGAEIDIKLEPEALEIINRYKKDKLLIGDFAKDRVQAARKLNFFLDKIQPGVTSYYCRHSWATIADSLDVPEKIIAMGLAHSWSQHVTKIYVRTDRKKLDAANRRVLDYVFKDKK